MVQLTEVEDEHFQQQAQKFMEEDQEDFTDTGAFFTFCSITFP